MRHSRLACGCKVLGNDTVHTPHEPPVEGSAPVAVLCRLCRYAHETGEMKSSCARPGIEAAAEVRWNRGKTTGEPGLFRPYGIVCDHALEYYTPGHCGAVRRKRPGFFVFGR